LGDRTRQRRYMSLFRLSDCDEVSDILLREAESEEVRCGELRKALLVEGGFEVL
jgi:hypothetical protein